MTEALLRQALRQHLKAQCAECIVVEEMVLERGAARIDAAMLSNQLTGFEIKSDLDGPERFFNQIHAYNRVFDEIYLVCSESFCSAMEPLLPSWWGMLAAHAAEKEGALLRVHRVARHNQQREAMSLALLLRRDELLSAHERAFRSAPPTRANKWQLQDQLAARLSLVELSVVVLTALKSRHAPHTHAL